MTKSWHARSVVGIFIVVAVVVGELFYGFGNTFSSSNFPVGNGDSSQSIWLLGWVAHSLSTGHNPLITRAVDLPNGANLMFNTPQLLLGAIASPLTLVKGPVVAFNVLVRLAPLLTGLSALFVLNRWTKNIEYAAIGGLIFAVGPFITSQMGMFGHIPLIYLVALPPFVLFFDRAFIRLQGSPFRSGLWLGAMIGLQFWISTEVLADLLIVSAISLVIFFGLDLDSFRRFRSAYLRSTVAAALSALVICGYGIYFAMFGPDRINHVVQDVGHLQSFRNDLAEIVFPSVNQQFTFGPLAHLTRSLFTKYSVQGGGAELGGFLGIPLILAFCFVLYKKRGDRLIRFLGLFSIVSLILSLGSRLQIDGKVFNIPLPETLLVHIPLLGNLVPARFAMLTMFGMVGVVAVGAVDLLPPIVLTLKATVGESGGRLVERSARVKKFQLVLPILILLSVFPHLPTGAEQSVISSEDAQRIGELISPNATVLTYPLLFPNQPLINVLQAENNFSFNVEGGDLYVPETQDSLPPLHPGYVEQKLARSEGWGFSVPKVTRKGAASLLCTYITEQGITAVIDFIHAPRNEQIWPWFNRAFGRPTATKGEAYIWTNVNQHCAERS